MTYSAFGTDDSDLDEWLRQQAESSSLDDLASPDAPMGGGMPAFHAPPHAQMAPLNYNTGPDWTDALGAGTSALAALADLGLNHGRGTGQILSSAGAFGQARAEQRLKGTQDALGYEQKRAELERQNNYNDYLYANLAKRSAGAGGISEYQQSQLDAKKTTADRLEQERQDRLANSKAADADRDAAREDRGETRKQHDQEFQLSLEDRKAAREAMEADRASRDADRQQTQADRAQERADKKETGDTDQFLQRTNETRAQAAALKGAESVIDDPKYAKDLPGVGPVDSRIPEWLAHPTDPQQREDSIKLQSLAGTAGQYFKHEITGAASSEREQQMLLGLKGLQPGATEQEFRTSIGLWKSEIQNELRARSTTNPGAARKALDAQGIGDWALGPAQQAASPVAAPQDPLDSLANYGPDADHPSNLGTAPAPKFSATPGGGVAQARGQAPMSSGSTAPAMGDGVMMQSPSGNSGPVPPDKVAAAIAAGWKRL